MPVGQDVPPVPTQLREIGLAKRAGNAFGSVFPLNGNGAGCVATVSSAASSPGAMVSHGAGMLLVMALKDFCPKCLFKLGLPFCG